MNYFLKSTEPGATFGPVGNLRPGDTITVQTDDVHDVAFTIDGFPDILAMTKTIPVNAMLQIRQREPGTWEFVGISLSQPENS